jgi:hypothetical protein
VLLFQSIFVNPMIPAQVSNQPPLPLKRPTISGEGTGFSVASLHIFRLMTKNRIPDPSEKNDRQRG